MLDGLESVLIIFGIAAVIDSGIILFLLRRVKRLKLLKSMDAQRATATLDRKLVSSTDGRTNVSHSIFYHFKDYKGVPVKGKHTVSPALFETLSEGDSIPITYHRTQPNINAHSDCVDDLIRKGSVISGIIIVGSVIFTVMVCVMFFIAHGTP